MSINMEKSGATTDLAPHLGIAYAIPRVNLLPPEVSAARAFRRTQAGLGACVLLVLAGVAGGFLLSQQKANDAQDALSAEQTRTSELQAQQTEYAQVPVVLAQLDSAEAARASALSGEVLWYRYLNDLALAYPANVWLGGLTASVASPTTAVVTTAGTDPLATPGIGTISFTGTAVTNPDVANWLEVLAQTPGFADAALSSATRVDLNGQTVVDFTTQVVVTPDALSHRFDREAS